MSKRIKLEFEAVRRMYVDEGLGYIAIARHFGCSWCVVHRTLREAGIHIRSLREQAQRMNERPEVRARRRAEGISRRRGRPLEIEEVKRLYNEEQRSVFYVARTFGASRPTVRRYLEENGIRVRDMSEQMRIEYKRPGYKERIAPRAFDKSMLKGPGSPTWSGGRKLSTDGYWLVYVPNHPSADRNGYVREHRHVMEQHLSRLLTAKEVVHHLDEDKLNNEIKNLEVLTNSEHARLHGIERGGLNIPRAS